MIPMSISRFGRLTVDNLSHYRFHSALGRNLRKAQSSHVRHNSTVSEEAKNAEASEAQNLTETEKALKLKLDNVTEEFEKFKVQAHETLEMWKRGVADAENTRKRMEKQMSDTRQYSIQKFSKDVLEVADSLSKAIDCVPKAEVNDKNPHLKNLFEGLTITESELQRVFRSHHLTQINPIGEKFDPNFHQALFDQEVADKEPGTIIIVSKIGYKLHDRVIRPALVGISKAVNTATTDKSETNSTKS